MVIGLCYWLLLNTYSNAVFIRLRFEGKNTLSSHSENKTRDLTKHSHSYRGYTTNCLFTLYDIINIYNSSETLLNID